MKGLSCGIFENKEIGNCSNGGISETHTSVILIMEDREAQVFEPNKDHPAVKIVKRSIGSKEYYHAEPVKPIKKGNVGYMFGGAYIKTSDSRFPFDYPLPLHDRQETPEEYERLSK